MDTIAPTKERIARANFGVEAPEVTQRADRRAYIVRDIWSDLHRRGQITPEEAEAGKRFAAHLEIAYRGRSITPSYGTRLAEGTPVGQLSASAADADAARVIDYVTLHKDAKAILPPTGRIALLLACEGKNLAQIGRLIATYRDDNRAVVAAVITIKTALELLSSHYGIIRDG